MKVRLNFSSKILLLDFMYKENIFIINYVQLTDVHCCVHYTNVLNNSLPFTWTESCFNMYYSGRYCSCCEHSKIVDTQTVTDRFRRVFTGHDKNNNNNNK